MGEEVAQRHQDSAFLLAAGGDHRLQAGIYRCPVVGAKTAAVRAKRRSAPPPDFGRAQVSFGPVVGERDTFHRREGRDRLVLPQAAIWGVPGPPGVRAVVLPVPPGSRSGGSVAGRLWPPLRARGEPARGGPTGRYASPRARTGGREGQRFLRLPHRGPAVGLRGCAPGAGRRATGGAAMGKQVLRVPLVVSLYLSGMPERPAAVEKEEK